MTDNAELQKLREDINTINDELVRLLNKRAEVAIEIGRAKQGAAIYDPVREQAVLDAVVASNEGPLADRPIQAIFKEIIAACRAIQEPLSVAYLGPEGTYSEEAARRQCGTTCQFMPYDSIDDAVRAVEAGNSTIAVVPIENSTEGSVNRTLDLLQNTSLHISGEVLLPIHHQLLSKASSLRGITAVSAHPQALAQCREWLTKHLPGVSLIAASSNAAAAKAATKDSKLAAIAGKAAADTYNLPVLAANIEDDATNTTRFVVLGRQLSSPSGNDKTSLIWTVANRPGSLQQALAVLAAEGVNMVKLESRPAGGGTWDYSFYVDIDGHETDKAVAKALDKLRDQSVVVKVLGSYPKGDADARS